MKTILLGLLWRIPAYSLLLLLVFSFIFFRLYTRPKRYISPYTPKEHGLAYEPVKLKTADGVELDAWFVPAKGSDKAILVCHGYPMDKGNVLTMAKFLNREFNLLFIDLRGMGKSGQAAVTGGYHEARDIEAAAAWLRSEKKFDKIGAYGFSMGASAIIMADTPLIRAKVCDSPFARVSEVLDGIFSGWGPLGKPLVFMIGFWSKLTLGVGLNQHTPLAAAARCSVPLLLIHGDKDSQVPYKSSVDLQAACKGARLWTIKGADHGESYGFAGSKYEKDVTAFFRDNLK